MTANIRHSRAHPEATAVLPYPDIELRLVAYRDAHAERIMIAMKRDPVDYDAIKQHEPLVQMAHDALVTIRLLAAQNGAMTKVLKNRVIIALGVAEDQGLKDAATTGSGQASEGPGFNRLGER